MGLFQKSLQDIAAQQAAILGRNGTITQRFGNVNPSIERFSRGVNTGTDIGVPVGTSVAVPQGNWQVVDAYGNATNQGYIGDNTNKGYGNSILTRNMDTGEQMRFSHLLRTAVSPGQQVSGGTLLGYTGATGNVTGPHLDLEYYNPQGKLSDVLSSPYAKTLFSGGYVPPEASAPLAQTDPQELLNRVRQKYGQNVVAISSDPSKFQGKGRIIRVTV